MASCMIETERPASLVQSIFFSVGYTEDLKVQVPPSAQAQTDNFQREGTGTLDKSGLCSLHPVAQWLYGDFINCSN